MAGAHQKKGCFFAKIEYQDGLVRQNLGFDGWSDHGEWFFQQKSTIQINTEMV